MKGLFITGTGTGVGKTVVAAAVTAWLKQRLPVVPMKPIQTGAYRRKGIWRSPDLDFVLHTARLTLRPREYKYASPYCYAPACSPHLAARLAHRPIIISRLIEAAKALSRSHRFLVVEGAGGVLVPINSAVTMLDLMRVLRFPVLVVAKSGLGTLNHTFLTLRALEQARLPVGGIVLCGRFSSFIEKDNVATIRKQTRLPVSEFPYCPSARTGRLSQRDLERTHAALEPLLKPLLEKP